jgi:hypothetical protein
MRYILTFLRYTSAKKKPNLLEKEGRKTTDLPFVKTQKKMAGSPDID